MRAYLKAHFHSLASVAIRGLSVLAGFVITFFIGRAFGPVATGQYALVTQTGLFLSILAVGGMDMAVVRRFSATMVRHVPLSRGSLFRALGYSLGVALVIALLLMAGGTPLFARLFGGHLPQHAVILIGLVLIARSATRMTAAVMRSQNRHIVAQTVEVLAIPTGVAILLALGVLVELTPVLWATVLIGIAVGLFGIVRVLAFTGRGPDAIDVPMRDMFQIAMPLWLTAIALNIADWYGLATAASVLGVHEAGLYRIAFQIAGALGFVAMGMYSVFTARISTSLEARDIWGVARHSRAATRLAILMVAPVVIGLLLFARPLLALIGPEFTAAAPLLQILVVGQAIYVATGPAGLVLAMTGHQRHNFAISASITGLLLIVAPIAAHQFGLTGLAIAMALVPVAGNIANLIAVHRLEKMNILTGRYFGEDEDEDDAEVEARPA